MGIGWQRSSEVPSKVAIYKARQRLGREPLELLFRAVAVPLASASTRGRYRQWRLVSLDGTCLDVADTDANTEAFGRPGSSRREGGGAFPQLRLVALAETGTHAIFDAALGSCGTSEQELAERLWPSPSTDTGCCASQTATSIASSGSKRPVRRGPACRGQGRRRAPAREQPLPDGSYLTSIYALKNRKAKRDGEPARVIEYRLEDPAPVADEEQRYRLHHHDPRPRPGTRGRARRALPTTWELEVAPG